MSDGAFRVCPICRKQRRTTRTGVMGIHRKWNGKKMVPCGGSLKTPAKS